MTPFIQLRTFLEVHRAQSISRASATLGITQPAASAHIRTLEQQIGRSLFRRHARGVEATPMADELAALIAPGLEDIDISFSSLRARTEAVVGTIRIAGPSEFMREKMVGPIAKLHAIGLSARIQLGGRDLIYRALNEGEIDLAITASRPQNAEIGFTLIAEEVLVPVASPTWIGRHLKGQAKLDMAVDYPCIAYDEDLALIAKAVENENLDMSLLRADVVVPDLRMVRDLVEAASGWSVLPDYLIEPAIENKSLVRLETKRPDVKNQLYLAWPKASLRHPRVSYTRDKLIEILN